MVGAIFVHGKMSELLSGVPDFFDRNNILSGYDLSKSTHVEYLWKYGLFSIIKWKFEFC